jgi:hypothetical protein
LHPSFSASVLGFALSLIRRIRPEYPALGGLDASNLIFVQKFKTMFQCGLPVADLASYADSLYVERLGSPEQ